MNKSLLLSSKVFVFAVLLTGISYAMEQAPALNPAPAAVNATPAPAVKPVVAPAAKSCASCFNIKENWNTLTTALSTKKTEVVRYAADVKARGWTNLSRNEKVAFVAAGAAVAAVVTYGIYKLYKSCTKTDKNQKDSVRKNRN